MNINELFQPPYQKQLPIPSTPLRKLFTLTTECWKLLKMAPSFNFPLKIRKNKHKNMKTRINAFHRKVNYTYYHFKVYLPKKIVFPKL